MNLRNEAGDIVLRRQVGTDWRKRAGSVQLAAQTTGDPGGLCEKSIPWISFEVLTTGYLKLLAGLGAVAAGGPCWSKPRLTPRIKDRPPRRQPAVRLYARIASGCLPAKRSPSNCVTAPPSETGRPGPPIDRPVRRATRQRTRTINAIHLICCSNTTFRQTCPTKGLKTKAARALVLAQLELPRSPIGSRWICCSINGCCGSTMRTARPASGSRSNGSTPGLLLAFGQRARLRGLQQFGLWLSAELGRHPPFCRPAKAWPTTWGLTPGCRNSGGEARQRVGPITKQGSAIARFVLGQLVLHVLKRDARMRHWYKQIKNRRGSKIARVAVMRG